MPLFTPQNADLLAGQQQGYRVLEANTGTQTREVGRLMDRYGAANAEYLAKMVAAQKEAEGLAKLRLDAKLEDAQLRSRIHEYKLQQLRRQYKQQEKDQKNAMWAALIGAGSALAPGAYKAVSGMFAPPHPGQISYTPPSEIYRLSPFGGGGLEVGLA